MAVMTNTSQYIQTIDGHLDEQWLEKTIKDERHTLLKAYGRQALVSLCTCGKKYLRVVDNIIDEYIKSL